MAVLAVMLVVDSRQFAARERKQYQLTLLPKPDSSNRRVIWYDFRRATPEVEPERRFGPGDRPLAEKVVAPKPVIANSPDPSSTQQLIWRPDRPERLPRDVAAPNLVALPETPAPPPKSPPRKFVPPPADTARPAPGIPPVEAPTIEQAASPLLRMGAPNSDLIDSRPKLPKPPPRQLVLPQSAPAAVPRQEIGDSPQVPGAGTGSVRDLKAVIIGLNPADKLAGPPPEGSRGARFSQAPDLGTPSSGPAGSGSGARVPGLLAKGDPGAGSVASPATAGAAVPERRILREFKVPSLNRTLSAPLRPEARVIPAAVEAVFANRNVYTLLFPAPDVPLYDGDWVIWFSARQAPETALGRIAAPVPVRKFSLEGGESGNGAGVHGTMQIAAIIDRGGRISSARVLRGPQGEAIRKRAADELLTWEFQPALNNGQPMEVDVVLEITFRAAAR